MKTSFNLASVLALASILIALSPEALAVQPPPGGGYPNQNTALGEDSLFSLSLGTDNTALGYHALYLDSVGSFNTAVGSEALSSNDIGAWNTAVGMDALVGLNGPAEGNTAVGYYALGGPLTVSAHSNNVAVGFYAMAFAVPSDCTAVGTDALMNTTGFYNTAVGFDALQDNTTGEENTATGWSCLNRNTTGIRNTAAGFEALFGNTSGKQNSAFGFLALEYNSTGDDNVAFGQGALHNNISASGNCANGVRALFHNTAGAVNTALGFAALEKNTTGQSNIGIGVRAGENLTTGSNNIDIGNSGLRGEANTIRLGTPGRQSNAYVAGVSGVTVAGGVAVVIDSQGHLGTSTSSARYKQDIKPMKDASAAILSLNPVSFRYKKDLDPAGIPQFGLVAEEVAKVDPDLVAQDDTGKPYTVRYEAVNAMLLNEFLKEHRKVEALEEKVARLAATVEKQSTLIEKGSAVRSSTRLVSANE